MRCLGTPNRCTRLNQHATNGTISRPAFKGAPPSPGRTEAQYTATEIQRLLRPTSGTHHTPHIHVDVMRRAARYRAAIDGPELLMAERMVHDAVLRCSAKLRGGAGAGAGAGAGTAVGGTGGGNRAGSTPTGVRHPAPVNAGAATHESTAAATPDEPAVSVGVLDLLDTKAINRYGLYRDSDDSDSTDSDDEAFDTFPSSPDGLSPSAASSGASVGAGSSPTRGPPPVPPPRMDFRTRSRSESRSILSREFMVGESADDGDGIIVTEVGGVEVAAAAVAAVAARAARAAGESGGSAGASSDMSDGGSPGSGAMGARGRPYRARTSSTASSGASAGPEGRHTQSARSRRAAKRNSVLLKNIDLSSLKGAVRAGIRCGCLLARQQ